MYNQTCFYQNAIFGHRMFWFSSYINATKCDSINQVTGAAPAISSSLPPK